MLLAVLLFLSGCGNLMRGSEGLLAKAREEIPLADMENMELRIAGACAKGEKVLYWFVTGNEHQAHSYFPMLCTQVRENVWRFEHLGKAMDRGRDIAVYLWDRSYSFLVNNEACTAIEITGANGTERITIRENAYPFVYLYDGLPTEYRFLAADGSEVR